MPKNKKRSAPDLISDGTAPFEDGLRYYTARLKEKSLTQKERMSCSLQLALAEQATGRLKTSMDLLTACEKYILAHGQPRERCTIHLLRALHLMAAARFDEAMPEALRALQMAQQTGIPILRMRSLACCGRICLRLLMHAEAIDYMNQGLSLARSLSDRSQTLLFMYQLSDIKRELLTPQEALRDAENLLAYRKATNMKQDIADAHVHENAARAAMKAGDPALARQYATTATEIRASLAPNASLLAAHHLLMAEICSAEGDEKGMLSHSQRATDMAAEQAGSLSPLYACQVRIDHFIRAGKLSEAKKQLTAAVAIAAAISTTLSDHLLDECSLRYYSAAGDAAQELIYMKKIHEYSTRTQQQVISHRLSHMNAIHELELREKENEIIKKELNLRSQELSLSNHHLQQRNELLNDLRSSINELRNENSKREVVFQTLFRKIDHAFVKEENDRDLFKQKFDSTHADFIRALSRAYPALSPSECRICALLHSGFNTKEIATLLSTSLRNIETHRLSIRKKLKLKRTDNLQFVLAAVRG